MVYLLVNNIFVILFLLKKLAEIKVMGHFCKELFKPNNYAHYFNHISPIVGAAHHFPEL